MLRTRTWLLPVLLLPLFTLALFLPGCQNTDGRPAPTADAADSYLFCFWNVENFFDDHKDERTHPADKEYDAWFAENPSILKEKLDHLSDALIRMNDGRGPDILAIVEVESLRAAALLQEALNKRLSDPALHYTHVLMKELSAGRHIAPAILTRLPVIGDKTRLHGRRQRILEGHVIVDGHDLVVLASHWTSRLTDKTGQHRADYASQIYGTFYGMYKSNPAVDFLVCGDFNDPPDAPSVTEHLHATSDRQKVEQGDGKYLLDLFAGKDPKEAGTHYYGGHWLIFDHIVVSPGLLDDKGWSIDPGSAHTENSLSRPGDRLHRPWRFGSPHDRFERGYSDHFPVTARLHVQAK